MKTNNELKYNPFPLDFKPGKVDATEVKAENIDNISSHLISAANLLILINEEDLANLDPEQIFSYQFKDGFKVAMSKNDKKEALKFVQLQTKFMELQYAFLQNRKTRELVNTTDSINKYTDSIRLRIKSLISLPKKLKYSKA